MLPRGRHLRCQRINSSDTMPARAAMTTTTRRVKAACVLVSRCSPAAPAAGPTPIRRPRARLGRYGRGRPRRHRPGRRERSVVVAGATAARAVAAGARAPARQAWGAGRGRPGPSARRAPAGRVGRPAGRRGAVGAGGAGGGFRTRRRRRRDGRLRRGGAGGGTGGTAARWTCPIGSVHGAEPVEHHADEGRRRAAVRQLQQQREQLRKHRGRLLAGRRALRVRDRERQQPAARAHPARDATGSVSIAYATSGTNGLAIDPMGRLIGASHTAGGILAFNLTNMTSTPVVSAYMSKRLQHAQRSDRAQRRDDLLQRSRLPGAEPAAPGR